MRCISLHQPHASFIAYGFKPFETRHWMTDYRGPLLIHAAKRKMDRHDIELARKVFAHDQSISWGNIETRFFGAILCIVDLWACVPTDSLSRERLEYSNGLGNFSQGRFAWELKAVHRFTEPIPCKGHQGFWNEPNPSVARIYQPSRKIVGETA